MEASGASDVNPWFPKRRNGLLLAKAGRWLRLPPVLRSDIEAVLEPSLSRRSLPAAQLAHVCVRRLPGRHRADQPSMADDATTPGPVASHRYRPICFYFCGSERRVIIPIGKHTTPQGRFRNSHIVTRLRPAFVNAATEIS